MAEHFKAFECAKVVPAWEKYTSQRNKASLKKVFMFEISDLDSKMLVWAIQNSIAFEHIKRYLNKFEKAEIANMFLWQEFDVEPLFAAVQERRLDVFRLLLQYGADPNQIAHHIPILGFAIFDTARNPDDTTEFVLTLLTHGANAKCIPEYMWRPFLPTAALGAKDSRTSPESLDPAANWIRKSAGYEKLLGQQLHLTQRYFLNRASGSAMLSPRRQQVAKMYGMTALREVPYHIIGQEHGTTDVINRLLSHAASLKDKPLVLAFAGLSGHGKTELAMQMGKFLSAESLLVDCTEMKHETDLFGPKAPFKGSEEGSPLNNHLCSTTGRRSIVFLDEFDKTTEEVEQSLLLILQDGKLIKASGEYKDRRNHTRILCARSIWIFATNLGDSSIMDFHSRHLEGHDKESELVAPWGDLQKRLRTAFAEELGNPITGRISCIIPFMPFSEGEAAVIAHKYVLELAQLIRKPVNLEKKVIIGNVDVILADDGKVCTQLTKQDYDPRFGARSIQRVVETRVEAEVHRLYLDLNGEVTEEQNDAANLRAMIKLRSSEDGEDEVVVSMD